MLLGLTVFIDVISNIVPASVHVVAARRRYVDGEMITAVADARMPSTPSRHSVSFVEHQRPKKHYRISATISSRCCKVGSLSTQYSMRA